RRCKLRGLPQQGRGRAEPFGATPPQPDRAYHAARPAGYIERNVFGSRPRRFHEQVERRVVVVDRRCRELRGLARKLVGYCGVMRPGRIVSDSHWINLRRELAYSANVAPLAPYGE